MDETLPPTEAPKKRDGIGPMAAIILLLLIFVVGGVYVFLHERERLTAPPVQETINA